jgi:acyl-CoA synthetase (AMP-forming)/AMP-acid ligase II
MLTVDTSTSRGASMRPHLATIVDDFRRHGNATAVVTFRGNRRKSASYREVALLAERFAAELKRRDIAAGERVLLWGQNSAEWISSFFGCVLQGVLVVPLDAAGGIDFARRVVAETSPKLIVGDQPLISYLPETISRLVLDDLASVLPLKAQDKALAVSLNLDTPLQILFTSGTTAEPKGVVHTHRNVLASIAPIEKEMQKYLRYARALRTSIAFSAYASIKPCFRTVHGTVASCIARSRGPFRVPPASAAIDRVDTTGADFGVSRCPPRTRSAALAFVGKRSATERANTAGTR